MGTVCLDVCFFSHDTVCKDFRTKLGKDIFKRGIKVIYSKGKYENELKKYNKVFNYFLELKKAGLLTTLPQHEIDQMMVEFNSLKVTRCAMCDDPHLFSMMKHSNCKYLFSADGKLLDCKKRLLKCNEGKKYTKFITIKTEKTYNSHKHKI